MAELMDVFERHPSLRHVIECRPLPITAAEPALVQHRKSIAPKGKKRKAAEDAKGDFAYLVIKDNSGKTSLVPEDDPRPAINVLEPFAVMAGSLPAPPKP